MEVPLLASEQKLPLVAEPINPMERSSDRHPYVVGDYGAIGHPYYLW